MPSVGGVMSSSSRNIVVSSGWKSFASTSSVVMSPTRTVAASISATGGWCLVIAGTGTTVTPADAVEIPSEIV